MAANRRSWSAGRSPLRWARARRWRRRCGSSPAPSSPQRLDGTSDFLSPHLGVDPDEITDGTSRRLLDLLLDTKDVRFDGSDLMPPAVGSGTFWTGMRAFFAGEQLDAVLAEIQAGWPDSASE